MPSFNIDDNSGTEGKIYIHSYSLFTVLSSVFEFSVSGAY